MKQNRTRPDRPEKGRRHFKEGLEFFIRLKRLSELRRLLKAQGLRPERDYVFSLKNDRFRDNPYRQQIINSGYGCWAILSFKDKARAALFKLSWDECEYSKDDLALFPKVVLPVIRRVMPSVIAHDIVGVQPMTGAMNSIMTLRTQYADAQTGTIPRTSTSDSSEEVRPDERRESGSDRTSE